MADTVAIGTSRLKSPQVTELYITAAPAPGGLAPQAKEIFSAIAAELHSSGGRILQERIFLSPGAREVALAARADAYGDLDDGVPASLLQVSPGFCGRLSGAQVHAVAGGCPPQQIELDGAAVGRIFRADDYAFLTVSGLSAPQAGAATEQARAMLEKAHAATRLAGGDMFSVARTWMWLGDILAWYDDFNAIRNEFFEERGLLDAAAGQQLPASTGVGVAPAEGGNCAMDLVAVIGEQRLVEKTLLAGGDQGSAFHYGSAFSRGLRAKTPAGSTVYISGTAAIDAQGRTEHLGDAPAQVVATIAHARAVLDNFGCGDRDVVQAIIYCKTPQVERAFRDQYGDLCWPRLVVVCDICREDLLFEVEVTACPGAEAL